MQELLRKTINAVPSEIIIFNYSEMLEILETKGFLPPNYKPHKLTGDYTDCWECHILPDWLLIWMQENTQQELIFIQTGTHSDLF